MPQSVAVPLIEAVGVRYGDIVLVEEEEQPLPAVTVSDTLYDPTLLKVCATPPAEELPPSPKFQA